MYTLLHNCYLIAWILAHELVSNCLSTLKLYTHSDELWFIKSKEFN